MKKLLITLIITIFSFSLFAQERELSDYELYRMEMEQELYEVQDTSDAPDTVYVVLEQEAEPVIVNNYYNGYNQPNYRFLLSFGSFYRPYHQPYNSYYGSWYNSYQYNIWFEYESYYGYYYGYYGSHYSRYYGYNGYHSSYYSRPNGRHYSSSAGLGWKSDYYRPYNKTNRSGYVPASTVTRKNTAVRPITTRSATHKTNYRSNYNKPSTTRTTIAPQARTKRSTTVSTPARTKRSTTRSSSTYKRPAQTRSRSYSTPSRAPSKSYSRSTPSRSRSSYSRSTPSRSSSSYSRSSSPSSTSTSRSSGGSRSSKR